MQNNSLISIIMPVKNGEKYLKEALIRLKKQNMNIEIIVVDDASTDSTALIAEDCGATVIKNQKSVGPVVAKNIGIKQAKGDYIMFHDHDDIMNDDSLSKLYEALNEEIDSYAVMAKVQDFYSPELSDEEKKNTPIKKESYYGLFTGAVLMKKELFDIIGEFDESVQAGEIISWQAQLTKHNISVQKLDFVSANRRIHTKNFGKTRRDEEFKDYSAILRKKILAARGK